MRDRRSTVRQLLLVPSLGHGELNLSFISTFIAQTELPASDKIAAPRLNHELKAQRKHHIYH